LKENALVVRRMIKPGKLAIPESRIEIRPLERERINAGRMTAKFHCVALGGGDQAAADSAAPQIGLNP
jgi:hypothetical protein